MDYVFSNAVQQLKSSAVRDILKLTQGNAIISFAGGLPAEELFPVDAVQEAMNRVFTLGKGALQYGLTEGYTPLREKLCERMARKRMNVAVDNMILTTGSQQAIDLLARVYLDPSDVVLVENPTYLAALQVFKFRGANVIPVESDSDGMILEDLERKVKEHRPKMVYVVPTFSNPTGNVWSVERRKGLLQTCKANNLLILEDDPYGEIQFDGQAMYPTILSMEDHPNGACVVYTSTFSKTVAPALRTGWAIGDPRIIQMMAKAKQASDLHSSTLDQQALNQLLEHFPLDDHIELIRRNYKERMLFMVEELNKYAWNDIRWNVPKGGMFLWMELPDGVDSSELLKVAVQQGVAFVPGNDFYAGEPRRNTLRLNYTHTDNEGTVVGVKRFADAIEQFTAKK